ncbi:MULTISPECIES: galactofuranose ABC transporter, permease protein YjfF [unclassified Thalassospira]|uniref:galactofuranose ABC transporter, permease protein YjfF n=1 Tax=unclassified Thalassospira TaxID=2648997 RepID=UPI000A1ED8CE|nr:galactofuranose ABC transporter, permease protein YjfF [Thalassospira sp. MCCC 1A01428]OSQ35543.1 ABC transporter permease [Thalassospira sp. MCCC 1A01428]
MINERYYPLLATLAVCALLYGYGIFEYRAFSDTYVLGNLLTDNAFLIITAVGMTFVILSGGIDLSVGSMIAFVGVLMAELVTGFGIHPLVAVVISLVFGAAFGAFMGLIIAKFDIQPFIITLAGMFFLRGMCFLINLDSVPITHDFVSAFGGFRIPLPGRGWLSASAIVMLVAVMSGIVFAHYTRFGRNVYAIGGDRQSAQLLGIPVERTIIQVYMLSGIFSALAGVVFAFYTASAYPLAAVGVELDAIAAVVIGGTLLTGGMGFVAGTFFGGIIMGVIQTLIAFDGSLNSWWTKIVIGGLLFGFIVLQRLITRSFSGMRAGAT